ncbi:MAG: gliding motility protein GldM [Bacteroidales bacterium]|nr:gliding motility protein GldM [Bacteroidales bacterium]
MAGGKQTPRQKMINLMYLVLMAMLALNVSSDVLNGFVMVENSIKGTTKVKFDQNNSLLGELEFYKNQNPQKAGYAFNEALVVKSSTDSLFDYIQTLKVKIAKVADGDEADVDNLKSMDNLDAASIVMLAPIHSQASKLKDWIEEYRAKILLKVPDSAKRELIRKNLTTEPTKRALAESKDWGTSYFENMPAIASITILSKIQNDIKNAESEVLYALLKSIDVGDFRVNSIKAYVVPTSTNIIVGGKYTAQLILSAEDSTKVPSFVVNGASLPANKKGLYETVCGKIGDFTINGVAQLTRGDGTISSFPFTNKYSVVAPMATVSATKMNILYAGWTNPISISVPGVPLASITATMNNGSLTRKGDEWIAIPNTSAIGGIITVTVKAKVGDREISIPSTFRVRKTPAPTASITLSSGNKFMGGKVSKFEVSRSSGLIAELEDLDIPFSVVSFDLSYYGSLGDVKTLSSKTNKFTEAQINVIERLQRNQMSVLSNIVVKGPSGQQTVNDISIISTN